MALTLRRSSTIRQPASIRLLPFALKGTRFGGDCVELLWLCPVELIG